MDAVETSVGHVLDLPSRVERRLGYTQPIGMLRTHSAAVIVLEQEFQPLVAKILNHRLLVDVLCKM